jgi:hypothetical protein
VYRIYWLFLTPLVLSLAVSISPAQADSEKIALNHQNPQNSVSNTPSNQNRETERAKKNPSKISAILKSLFQQIVKEERPLGSRGNLCAITPGLLGKNDKIWSDRPLFLWRGSAKKIVLRNYDTGELLWQQNIAAEQQSLAYDGQVLEPGKIYEWEIWSESKVDSRITFSVMGKQERERFDREIQNLAAQKQADKESAVDLAVELARYFSHKGLWSDAIAKLYALDNPPSQLVRTREEIVNYLCGDVR